MIVRREESADVADIRAVITTAFGRPDEAQLVDALRAAGDLVFSLVGVLDDVIVAHIAFSRMDAPFSSLALAPIAVKPEFQRRGFGSTLIRDGIGSAREEGWAAIFMLGDPALYEQFGFEAELAAGFTSPYSGPQFMALALTGVLSADNGAVQHAPAFAALG